MTIRRGANLLELLPTAAAGLVPDEFVERLGFLTVLDHHASLAPGVTVHSGTLQSLEDIFDIGSQTWDLRVPGLSTGLRFRLTVTRAAPPVQAAGGPTPGAGGTAFVTEAAPTGFQLDILVGNLEVRFRDLRAAVPVGGSGTSARHLEPMVPPQDVWFVASGAVQISTLAGAGPQLSVIDSPDPLDPSAPNGAVIRMTANPPHFLFGSSHYGATLDRLVLDLSRNYTPPEIAARHHGEAWVGIMIREAAFFLPPDTPVVGPLSVTVRELIMGDPFGVQGEAVIEMGQEFGVGAGGNGWMYANAELHDKLGSNLGSISGSGTKTLAGGPQPIKVVWFPDPPGVPASANDRAVAGVWYQLPDGRKGVCDVPSNANGMAPMVSPLFDLPAAGALIYRVRVAQAGAPLAQDLANPDAIPAGQAELAEVRVRLTLDQLPAPPRVTIDAQAGQIFENTACMVGRPADLDPFALKAYTWTVDVQGNNDQATEATTAEWHIASGGVRTGAQWGSVFHVDPSRFPSGAREFDIVCEVPVAPAQPGDPQPPPARRRVRVRVADVDPIIGCEGGPEGLNASANVKAARVVATELLDAFETDGKLVQAPATATIDPSTQALTVPAVTIAEVEVDLTGGGGGGGGGGQKDGPRGLHFMMKFDETTVTRTRHTFADPLTQPWARLNPAHPTRAAGLAYDEDPAHDQPLTGTSDVTAQITAWRNNLPADPLVYFVVGRTDDLYRYGSHTENDAYNDDLAQERLDQAVEYLTAAGIGPIRQRIERDPWATSGWSSDELTLKDAAPARIRDPGRLIPPDTGATSCYFQRGIGPADFTPDSSGDDAAHNTARADTRRFPYRTVEVWAGIPGVPPDPQKKQAPTATQLQVLVPGVDGPAPAPPISLEQDPPIDWRMRLRAKWDSPTVVSGDDAVPTEAEALIAWKKQDQLALPAANVAPATVSGPDYWEVLARFAYDVRTGITEVSGALTIPAGTLTASSDALAGAMAFAPALASLITDPGEAITDPAGYFLKCGAVIAVGAGLGALINKDGSTESSVDLRRFEVRYRWDGQDQLRATMDYAVDLKVAFGLAGTLITGSIKVNYKNVGVMFAWDNQGLKDAGLCFDAVSIEVADMGAWSITGPLGELVRIAASRFGRGSTWAEFDLELALDLGVIRLESATIRLFLEPDFGVELRGMKVGVNIENVLEGSGQLQLGDGGSVRAGVSCQIIPANLGAAGALALQGDFVAVEFKVSLPVGIPLANTGLAIYGFLGRFVANGARTVGAIGDGVDPAMRELIWYQKPLGEKYGPKSGQYALGLGAIIGTLPDNGFSFNAEGSLCIGFPDLSVVFGIDAKFAKQRSVEADEKGGGDTNFKGRIIGLTVIDSTAVAIAVKADLEVPRILRLLVPISAYFPYSSSDWFLRIGTDDQVAIGSPGDPDYYPGRPGDPVTLWLFPDDFDVKAWAFIMFEGNGLPNLGGQLVKVMGQKIDLGGFSIGMGCGFELHWEAGPVHADLSASLLIGLGTKPLLLVGQVQFDGEISIEIVSVSAYGYVQARVMKEKFEAHAHVCGKVDLLFDTVEGCIDFEINPDAVQLPPHPGSPVLGIDLCDHLAATKGKAAPIAEGDGPTVWPDTVAVVHFAHPIVDKLADMPGAPIEVHVSQAASSSWFGSTELKYAYCLDSVEVVRINGNGTEVPVAGPIDAAWWFPTHRAAIISGDPGQPDASPEEGRELGLFWWEPAPWSRWLTKDNGDLPGYPGKTFEHVCDSVQATESCAFGRDAYPLAPLRAAVQSTPKPGAVIPSPFAAAIGVREGIDADYVAMMLDSLGLELEPGGVTPLLGGPLACEGELLDAVWALPAASDAGQLLATLPCALVPSERLQAPEIYLLACFEEGRTETTPWHPPVTHHEAFDPAAVGEIVSRGVSPTGFVFVGELSMDTRGILIANGTVRVSPPSPADVFTIDLESGRGAYVFATDALGAVVATATVEPSSTLTVELRGRGIVSVTLQASDSIQILGAGIGVDPAAAAGDTVDPASPLPVGELPLVIGHRPDGSTLAFPGEILLWRDEDGHRCALLRYTVTSGVWDHFTIAPWTNGHLALVSLCGITETAAQIQSDDQDVRLDLIDLYTSGPGFHLHATPRPVLLDADALYEVRVTWRWQHWVPPFPGAPQPPPPKDTQWSAPETDVYRFRTAALGAWKEPEVPDPKAPASTPFPEDVFDPRGLSRYLMRMLPIHTDPPHFPSQTLGAWFNVDHLPGLLAKYDRELTLRVRRTNPPPVYDPDGVLLPPVFDAPCEIAIVDSNEPWFEVQADISALLPTLPCIGNPGNSGASSATVWAGLVPRAEYDFLIVAHPIGAPADEGEIIARNHFRASRYYAPEDLIRGLGLGIADELVVRLPDEALLTGAIPATVAPGDGALDDLLDQIGLGPWPLPSAGRTTLLWRETGADVWQLAGVLFESDEPIHRPKPAIGFFDEPPPANRLAISAVKVLDPANTTKITLHERARNVAGTRVLWAATSAPTLVRGRYRLQVTFDQNGASTDTHAPLFDRPLVVTQEAE